MGFPSPPGPALQCNAIVSTINDYLQQEQYRAVFQSTAAGDLRRSFHSLKKGWICLKRKETLWVVAAAVLCCGAMALVDGVLRPGYALKSAIKIALFLGVPLLLSLKSRELSCLSLLRFPKKGFLTALGLGAAVYGIILGGYFLVRPFFDFSQIAGKLTANAGVTKENFLYVSLYISFANSLLEEFFFRGFLFANLKKLSTRRIAYGISALAFAAYHVAMMLGWFSPALFVLVMAGLALGGMIFNYLNERMGTVYISWLVHMCANFAINTIGFLLLG